MIHRRNRFFEGRLQWCLVLAMAGLIIAGCKKEEDTSLQADPLKRETIPATDTLSHAITGNTLLNASHPWYIKGWVYVSNEASLRIEPGSVIKILPEEKSNAGGIIITRGSTIYAAGTERLPIHVSMQENGYIIVLGKAPVGNRFAEMENPENKLWPGLTYGGKDKRDSSGILQHIQIDYPAGKYGELKLLGTGNRTVVKSVTTHLSTKGLGASHLP
ncbi:hypothetical protein [Chitinophaga solisilvae]|uniref:hypothetical protein n=1 Tax=Chitinophaga solisilvae TaxID=1233460 RepID=UPI00136BD5E7|nr:hypothetical protein [Chitinophaga solisilvae]